MSAELPGERLVAKVGRKCLEFVDDAIGFVRTAGQCVCRRKSGPTPRIAAVERDRALKYRDGLGIVSQLEFAVAGKFKPYRHDRVARTEPHGITHVLQALGGPARPDQAVADLRVRTG